MHPVLKRIYAARNIQSVDELDYSLASLLPFNTLSNIDKAVSLLQESLKKQNRILIVADFDADGATSCALMMRGLSTMGIKNIVYVVPNRFEYGYGLTPEIVDVALNYEPDLLITVDNGISSIAGVKRAKENGVKVLITDHHLPAEELPDANAIINPQLIDDQFSSKNLAGVGVVFYILLALRAKLREEDWFEKNNVVVPNLAKLLDIVALGTVADVVSLDKNNRTMVAHGLKLIKQNKTIPGISAILNQSGRSLSNLSASDLGFSIAPKLNAAGRLTDMSLGIECLLTDDLGKAKEMANQLNELNKERRQIQEEMQDQAMSVLDEYLQDVSGEIPTGLCLYEADWHQGVIGILAAKVKEKFNRPVIAFAKEDDTEEENIVLKGSARSISGLHIRDLLEDMTRLYPDLILTFGGHAMAAGLTINETDYDKFSKGFVEILKLHLSVDEIENECFTDGELSANDLSMQFAQVIQNAGPWGQHFPEPVFEGRFKIMDKRIVGEKHLKLRLQIDGNNRIIDAIAFNITDESWPVNTDEIRTTYRLGINEFRGNSQLQLFIEYIEPL
ncbi:MAG: single-stranded-DNA-specific exonuclease RecJ [Proteobacteria bacterium]|nr:single-stranded-DNA-specific exonuclease RecJ [Pseudomonadota bacterium]NOG59711.1 single-stranded-DNA-specific exonuclease RecJ [Pseudomonadota bacterium]